MKKSLLFILAALIFVLLLTGCGNKAYSYDLGKYISFSSDYKSIELDEEAVEEDVQDALNSMADNYKTTQEVTEDRGAAEGDTVNVTYSGTMVDDSSKPKGATNMDGTDVVIGSGTMIEGFEDGLIGLKKGEKKTLHLTFPDPYENDPDLAGRAVDFEIEVLKLSETTPGEINDENVKDYTGERFATVDEYKDYLARESRLTKIREAILSLGEWKEIPKDEIKKVYNNILTNMRTTAANNGKTLEEYVTSGGGYSDLEAFLSGAADQAIDHVKEDMTLNYVLQQEGKEEIASETYDRIAGDIYGDYLSAYESYYGKDTILSEVRARYACELVLDSLKG